MKGKRMDSNEKFEQVYSRIVENNKKLEKIRIKAKNEKIRIWIIRIIGYFIGIILFLFLKKVVFTSMQARYAFEATSVYWVIVVSVDIFFWAIREIRSNARFSKYKHEFQKNIIKELVDSFEKNLNYVPNSDNGILSASYRDSEFQTREYGIWNIEDFIEGRLKDTIYFSMAEIITQYEGSNDGTNGVNPSSFHGLFVKIQLSKGINAKFYLSIWVHPTYLPPALRM